MNCPTQVINLYNTKQINFKAEESGLFAYIHFLDDTGLVLKNSQAIEFYKLLKLANVTGRQFVFLGDDSE
jgi:hypothetical protein